MIEHLHESYLSAPVLNFFARLWENVNNSQNHPTQKLSPPKFFTYREEEVKSRRVITIGQNEEVGSSSLVAGPGLSEPGGIAETTEPPLFKLTHKISR